MGVIQEKGSVFGDMAAIMQGAVEAVEFKKAARDLLLESANNLNDPVQQKRSEDWSILANQIVGAETLL